jgi:hypothetical protein
MSHDSPERTPSISVGWSISDRSEITTIYYRWNSAYRGVYNRMTALWRLGTEGREIVENDELCIAGKYDVRYRQSIGPKPDLKDPRYWEAKWQYFTEKHMALCCAKRMNTFLPCRYSRIYNRMVLTCTRRLLFAITCASHKSISLPLS